MTLDEIINQLKINGQGTKIAVLNKLEKSTITDLIELRNSINEKINIMRATKWDLNKR